MSEAMKWLTPRRCTSTSLTSPVMPDTVIDDGYGDAGPIWLADPVAGIAIAAVGKVGGAGEDADVRRRDDRRGALNGAADHGWRRPVGASDDGVCASDAVIPPAPVR